MERLAHFLPQYQFSERHHIFVPAPAEAVYQALWETDFSRSTLIRLLFGLRGMSRLEQARLHDFLDLGFLLLEETPHQEMILGLVGQPWQFRPRLEKMSPEAFVHFQEPRRVKVAWNFFLQENLQGTELSTETRIFCTDGLSKGLFAFYWSLIAPFSGIIRKEMLKMVEQHSHP